MSIRAKACTERGRRSCATVCVKEAWELLWQGQLGREYPVDGGERPTAGARSEEWSVQRESRDMRERMRSSGLVSGAEECEESSVAVLCEG